MFGSFSRRVAAFGSLALAAALVAQPVAAANVTSTTGHIGNYSFNDTQNGQRGVNCDYKTTKKHNGNYALKDLGVRGPVVYARDTGSGVQKQWVGWKFKVQRDTNFDNVYSTIFTSSVVKAKPSDVTPTGFSRRTWVPSGKVAMGNYRIQVIILWYKPGSTNIVQGTLKAYYQWYHVKGGGAGTVRNNNCYFENSAVPV